MCLIGTALLQIIKKKPIDIIKTFEDAINLTSPNCTILGFYSIVCPLTQFNPPFRSSGQSTASKLLARSPPAA